MPARIDIPTALILGAGASIPFGFPSGHGLYESICGPGTNRSLSIRQLEPLDFGGDFVNGFLHNLSLSGVDSIDEFLGKQPEYTAVGKAAIAQILLPCEKQRHLFDPTADNWYKRFFVPLLDHPDGFRNLYVITFNYDRSLEHFLFTALRSSTDLSEAQCAERVQALTIVHVHGKLGRLPWEAEYGHVIPYEGKANPDTIRACIGSIIVLHEGQKDSPELVEARRILDSVLRIYFLGFGYHEVNLERLG
ncbi:hypothetical protein LCGC14_2850660, partial [marine sediment metagenome]